MKYFLGKALILSLLALMIFADADAQWRRRPGRHQSEQRPVATAPALGIRVGNDFNQDNLLLGGQLWLPAGRFWQLAPGFDYFFIKDGARWQFNGDLVFKPRPRGFFYLGGGLAVDYKLPETGASQSMFGGNALLGLDLGKGRRTPIWPFIQARWTFFEDLSYFSLIGGINLALR